MRSYPPPAAHMAHARIVKRGFDFHLEIRDPKAEEACYREWHRYKIYATHYSAKRACKRMQLVLVAWFEEA